MSLLPGRGRCSRDPERVAQAYRSDSVWRNGDEFIVGRTAIIDFLRRRWSKERDYRLVKQFVGSWRKQNSVRFQYDWRDDAERWYRSYGNEQWEFDASGLMARREASINDMIIAASERRFLWDAGPRPAQFPGLGALDESTLNNLGVFHFDQIAGWSEAQVLWMENHVFARGRIGRENWQQQARDLATASAG